MQNIVLPVLFGMFLCILLADPTLSLPPFIEAEVIQKQERLDRIKSMIPCNSLHQSVFTQEDNFILF